MNKYIKIAITIVVVAGLGVVGAKKIKAVRATDASLAQAKIYPIVVSKISPKIVDAKLTLPYLAEVANERDVKLSSRIAARVVSIKPSGSRVKRGEIIVKLDTTSIKSSLKSIKEQLQAATISLKNLEATHSRTLELLKIQGASIEESQKEATMIANTNAQIVSLRQKEIELKNNLSYATILSPVDGVIAKTYSNKGAVAMPGKYLIAISSKNGFYLMVRVPTNTSIQGVEFDSKSYEAISLGSTYNGLGEYKIYIGDTKLTSGDRVEVNVIVYNQKGLLLPFDAILNRDSKSYILEISKNRAVPKEVHIIQSAEQGLIVSENLEGKDIVIAKPDILLKLTSGYALKVKE